MSLHKDKKCTSINIGFPIMTNPKYFEHDDQCIRFLEWRAMQKFTDIAPYKQFPEYAQRYGYWAEHFTDNKKQWHSALYAEVMNGSLATLEDFYKVLKARLNGRKPKALGAQERKKQTQREYQQEKLGDAFVENNALISAIKLKAKELSDTKTPDEDFQNEVSELASELSERPLSDNQLKALSDLLSNEISKHQALDRAEANLIDMNDKNAWFLWGKIKRNHTKDSTFTLSARQIADYATTSKDSGTKLIKILLKAGVIQQLSKGKSSGTERIAPLFKRLL